MDALALDEVPGRSYGSQVAGRMHACGHDADTSALLGVAALLKSRRENLAGSVRLLFQPAEEIGAGALAIIDDGALDGVDEAIMAHVFSQMPFGTVALREGVALAGADLFELTVESGGGHAALAHETRDAVFATAQLVSALQSITARETSPRDFLVLGVASIAGGEAATSSPMRSRSAAPSAGWTPQYASVRSRGWTRSPPACAGRCVSPIG